MFIEKLKSEFAVVCAALLISGCTGSYVDSQSFDFSQYIGGSSTAESSLANERGVYKLSLNDALHMGLKQNLDLRIAALETLSASDAITLQRLEAFPSVQAKYNVISRSNPGASSSLSVLTGNQSLEPSVSTEQTRRTSELETSWNLLDVALAVLRSKTASDRQKIAAERQRKVAHNLKKDIVIAYHRALAAQKSEQRLFALKKRAEGHLTSIDHAMSARLVSADYGLERQDMILQRLQQFDEQEKSLSLASVELKTLLNLHPSAILELNDEAALNHIISDLPVADDIASLEEFALKNRPEISEQFLNQNIALRNKRLAVLETFPGASFLFTFNRDSNKYLQDNQWLSMTGSLVQSITKILTLPARIQSADTAQKIEDQKTQSIIAAILAQVNIAKHQVDLEKSSYNILSNVHRNSARKAAIARIRAEDGLGTHEDNLIAAMDEALSSVNKDVAYVGLQGARASLLNSLGFNIETTEPSTSDQSSPSHNALFDVFYEEQVK